MEPGWLGRSSKALIIRQQVRARTRVQGVGLRARVFRLQKLFSTQSQLVASSPSLGGRRLLPPAGRR